MLNKEFGFDITGPGHLTVFGCSMNDFSSGRCGNVVVRDFGSCSIVRTVSGHSTSIDRSPVLLPALRHGLVTPNTNMFEDGSATIRRSDIGGNAISFPTLLLLPGHNLIENGFFTAGNN